MSANHLPWVALELTAKRELNRSLRSYLRLVRHANGLVGHAIQATTSLQLGEAAQVQARLLVQASLQLRTVSVAAERGYALQAVGGGATVYELAAAVGYLRNNDERARRWLEHSAPHQSYPSNRDRPAAVRALLAAAGVGGQQLDTDVQDLERTYTFFCMAKHGNPIALRAHGLVRETHRLRLFHGPVGDTQSLRLIATVLTVGSILLAHAAAAYASAHLGAVPPADARRFLKALRAFGVIAAELPRPDVRLAL